MSNKDKKHPPLETEASPSPRINHLRLTHAGIIPMCNLYIRISCVWGKKTNI